MKRTFALSLLLAFAAASLAAQHTKYDVTVTADKNTDFSKFKTYAWEPGWKALDKNVHQQVVEAVDRELAALGFQKRDEAPVDVFVKYASLWRTDVDLKAKADEKVGRPTYEVGSLTVLLVDPATRRELFKGRGDKPIQADAEKIKPVIDGVVAEIFARYPTRKK